MAIKVEYDLIPWEDAPSTATPINAENLNKQQTKIKEIIDELYELDEAKLGKEEVPNVPVKSVNGKTGAVSLGKIDIGLGNVDNVKQYSASNPPPYPVTSVNGKTGAVTVSVPTKTSQLTNDSNFVTKSVTDALSGQIATKQPIGNYALKSEIPTVPVKSVNGKTGAVVLSASDVGATTKAYVDAEITDLEIRTQQQNVLFAVGNTQAEAEAWLKANGDTTKAYVMPDDTYWIYKAVVVNTGPAYTNVLPLAINADKTPYVGNNGEKGYKTGWRLNSSRVEKEMANRCCTGFIPVKWTDTIRFKNIFIPTDNNINGYVHFFASDFTTTTGTVYEMANFWDIELIPAQAKDVSASSLNATDSTAYMRISAGLIDETSVITINEEIVEGGGTTIEYQWASTGHKFTSTNYDKEIADITKTTDAHAVAIAELKDAIENFEPETDDTTDAEKLTLIKNWDAPIYDAHIPVFQLSAEKQAMTNATCTPDAIYAKYDALMAKHPRYITKTDLGLCSDGVNHVYRYDFKESEPLHESNKEWSEVKRKAIIVTGIHYEWAGIFAMYNALEEIADNPELRNFRRNTHLIVVPCSNPYATIANNYQSGLSTPNSYGVRNANGVEIHRNFEVEHVVIDSSNTHYGGATPLSEVETQYIDNIMKNNTDASLFLSCHNCGVDTFWGTGFIWASTATKHMTNMGYRVIDKLSYAWMDKYGDTLNRGIAEYKTDLFPDGETRLGWTGLSTSPGTEAKQATKYGIQGTNVEICDPFQIHGTKANPEPSMSSFTMSRGAEVYVNFLLTTLGVYDYKDKEQYYK